MSGEPAAGPPPRRPGRLLQRFDGMSDALLWASALLPWTWIVQLFALVLTCRVRAGTWPRPYVPDVDSIALPGQQLLWVLTMVFATVSLLVTPMLSISRRLTRRSSLWPLVLVNVAGFGTMMWLARQPIGAWAWD